MDPVILTTKVNFEILTYVKKNLNIIMWVLTKPFFPFWYNFFTLVSKKIEEEAFRRIYPNTLAVSGDENCQTWGYMSGNKRNTVKCFLFVGTSFIKN